MPRVERAIIMAAGLGNRMHPVTLSTPKPMVKVNGVRMIDTVIDGLHENEIYENSITQKNVVFVNEKGKKEKHLFNEFKSIEFIDLKGKERIFERPIEKYGLFELIYEGKKIKWYRGYNENMYDHSQGSYEIIVKSPNEYVFLDVLTNNRKKLKEIMYDRPDLFQLIEQINYNRLKDEQLIEVLKKYDE